MSFLVGPDSFRGSRGFYNKEKKKKTLKTVKEQRDLTDRLFYLTYVAMDSFKLFPVSRNGLQEILQLRCRVRHLLWSCVDSTPKTDDHTST